MLFRAPLFMLTGFCWLLLSAAWGLALFLGMVLGISLPPVLRALHPHSALVGGVVQIIAGMLVRNGPESRMRLYAAINGGTIALLAGFYAGHARLIAGAGLVVILALLPLMGAALTQRTNSLIPRSLDVWFHGIAWLALLIGLGMGGAMALRLLPLSWLGQGRLAHIHFTLLGFVTPTFIGAVHHLMPIVLKVPLHSPRLAGWTFTLLPAAVLALIAGFLTGNLLVDLAAGAVLILAAGLFTYNIVRTWVDAGRVRIAASDHFILASVFLMLTAVTGLLVTVNALWHPNPLPLGKLHLIAYTHLALIGFMLLTIIGVLTHLLPIDLALERIKSNKKRGPYLAELAAVAERWQAQQMGALCLGTIGLALVASLVWQLSLGDLPVRIAAWVSAGLLVFGLAIFTVKLLQILSHRPQAHSAD